MMTLLQRYEAAINSIGHGNLLAMPDDLKDKLKATTELSEKVELLEDLASCLKRQGLARCCN